MLLSQALKRCDSVTGRGLWVHPEAVRVRLPPNGRSLAIVRGER